MGQSPLTCSERGVQSCQCLAQLVNEPVFGPVVRSPSPARIPALLGALGRAAGRPGCLGVSLQLKNYRVRMATG